MYLVVRRSKQTLRSPLSARLWRLEEAWQERRCGRRQKRRWRRDVENWIWIQNRQKIVESKSLVSNVRMSFVARLGTVNFRLMSTVWIQPLSAETISNNHELNFPGNRIAKTSLIKSQSKLLWLKLRLCMADSVTNVGIKSGPKFSNLSKNKPLWYFSK